MVLKVTPKIDLSLTGDLSAVDHSHSQAPLGLALATGGAGPYFFRSWRFFVPGARLVFFCFE